MDNSGTIQDTASGGRAIRFENTISSTVNVTINNLTAGSLISGVDDAIQIQAASNGGPVVTAGLLTLNNAGTITSTSGQALD
jgi:ABC-type nitrate/sulfonate/bicarbonate transport system substrate-binding protein